jgi:hypothetical protein
MKFEILYRHNGTNYRAVVTAGTRASAEAQFILTRKVGRSAITAIRPL